MAALQKRIQIFRPGTFTPMSGSEITFSEDDVAGIAKTYNPQVHHAPIVVGHPKHDDPAYGWVSNLSFSDGHLVAELDEVDAAFAEAVSEGRYKRVSAAFYVPSNPNNPMPGQYYLKHVGFLGGMPPAVKGLKPVTEAAFASDNDLVVEFGDTPESLRTVSDLFRGLRELLLQLSGREDTDAAVPAWRVDWLRDEAARLEAASQADTPSHFSEQEERKEETMDEKELKAREEAVAAREASLRRAENASFVEELTQAGRPLAGEAGKAARDFMNSLDDTEMVAFGDGEVQQTRLAGFKAFLRQLPKAIEFGEIEKADPSVESVAFTAADGMHVNTEALQTHQRALAYQAEHAGTDYLTAVRAVETL